MYVNLEKILVESFRMLMEEPRIFLPKIFSTSISTIWIIGFTRVFFSGTVSLSEDTLLFYMASMPLIVLLGVSVSVMLAEMVAGQPVLRQSLMRTLDKWRALVATSFALISAGLLIYIPAGVGLGIYLLYGSIAAFAAGGAFSLLLLFAASFGIFFLPVTIARRKEFSKGLRTSLATSRRNYREVTLILVFSLILLGLAFTMQGALQRLGMLGFASSRLVSAVVTTYLFVVSPKMYLEEEE